MKKILIFYGSYGGGHLAAAKSIESYIKNSYPDNTVLLIDCMEYINKHLNKLFIDSYNEAAKKAPWAWKKAYYSSNNNFITSQAVKTSNTIFSIKLNKLLQEFNPDIIISTHPFGTQMSAVLKKRKKINCPIATVLTDFHIHGQWLMFHEYCDLYFVSNNQMKLDMIKYGIDEEKIYITGIPISEKFNKTFDKNSIYDEFNLKKDNQTVLFFAGGEFGLGNKTTIMTLKALIRLFSKLQIITISGKNDKMYAKFEKIISKTNSSKRVKLLKFSNKIPEIMSISEFVVTKPGGLTTSESLASNLPIIIINPIPGQEEENAEFLESNGCAIWIKKQDNVARILKNLYRNPETLPTIKENIKKISKPTSTKDICDIIISHID